jgi:hypothetical protein
MNLCQNCATINEDGLQECSTCKSRIDPIQVEKIVPFARYAAHYGYDYRSCYEEQVKETGEVHTKFSLLDPSNYFQLLAVVAISGYIGGATYDLVNYLGKQIISLVNKKSVKDDSDNEIIEFLKDDEKVKKFARYCVDYYKGYPEDKTVSDAIAEEEMADFASQEGNQEFIEAMGQLSPDDHEELLKSFTEIARGTAKKRNQIRPSNDDLGKLFKARKKEIKKERKKKRK